ncbi:MAG TPA: hypothetical protein VII74_09785 [Chthoniobacterales bacterium]
MRDEFHLKNKMYARVEAHLRDPQNEPLWLDHPPRLTEVVTAWEAKASALGALGEQQETSLKGVNLQQNSAEAALENASHPLARKLRRYYLAQGHEDKAGGWDLSLTKWQKMREDALLAKAKALRDEVTPLTTGTPAPGAHFGIDAAALAAYSPLVDRYGEELAKPGIAKSARKTQGEELRPRYREADADLDEMDDFIDDLRAQGDAQRMFVETYFNLRVVGRDNGGGSSPGEKPASNNPTPPNKPTA